MGKWLYLALCATNLQAAVLRGVVVEHQSGKPLSRAQVAITPVEGTPGGAQAVRSNADGVFEFPSVAAGAYLVSASRRAFAPAQYGQKNWNAAGIPALVKDGEPTIMSLRLSRYGAITGVVADEDDVGLPEFEVVVYRATRPPRLAGRARTDDRGMYRIGGLEPGSYLVRTMATVYDDAAYLPTFSRETARVDEAHTAEVLLDGQVDHFNVRPFPGRLVTFGGQVSTAAGGARVSVQLVSDMGTQMVTTDAAGNFSFGNVAPGSYEVYASRAGDARRGALAAFASVSIDQDRTDYRMQLASLPELELTLIDAAGLPIAADALQVLARRKALSGDGPVEALRWVQGRVVLAPGRWELMVAPHARYYATTFAFAGRQGAETRADGWNPFLLTGPATARFTVAPDPGSVEGLVMTGPERAVPGAPVFLQAVEPPGEIRTTRTDIRGRYRFIGLAPGAYRLLSTFEQQSPTAQFLAAFGQTFEVGKGKAGKLDLPIYVAP